MLAQIYQKHRTDLLVKINLSFEKMELWNG
jgi:hypothetical protein